MKISLLNFDSISFVVLALKHFFGANNILNFLNFEKSIEFIFKQDYQVGMRADFAVYCTSEVETSHKIISDLSSFSQSTVILVLVFARKVRKNRENIKISHIAEDISKKLENRKFVIATVGLIYDDDITRYDFSAMRDAFKALFL